MNGAGNIEARVPVAEVKPFLNVNAGDGVGGAEAPTVVTVGSFEAENVGAGVRVTGAKIGGLDFGGARGVNVEPRGESVVDGIADFETVEKVLRFARSGACDVKIRSVVLRDFGEGDKTLREDVRAGDGNVEDVARGKRVALRGVLGIDLVGASGDLDLFVNLFGVI